jgi:CorA-like Mg2+ transporter protein
VKRVLVQLRKIGSPQREVFNALSRRDSPYIGLNTAVYFRDVHDHLVRAFEIIDSYRDLVANTLAAGPAARDDSGTTGGNDHLLRATGYGSRTTGGLRHGEGCAPGSEPDIEVWNTSQGLERSWRIGPGIATVIAEQ